MSKHALAGVAALIASVGLCVVFPVRADGSVPIATKCARAAALAGAGEKAAAKKIYVALASSTDAPCAIRALSQLDNQTAGDRLISDVTRALQRIGSGLVVLLAVITAALIVFVVLSWTPLRAVLARTILIGRLFDPDTQG